MMDFLPPALVEELRATGGLQALEEVHLRADRTSSVTRGGVTHPLAFHVTRETLDAILHAATGGSIYAYRDNIRAGYITLAGGVRMGLCGRALTEGDAVVAVTDLNSLCFRIPHHVPGVAEEVYRMWDTEGGQTGILVVAPPACGKTTFLRDFILYASSGAHVRRVAVVDSREELCYEGVCGMVDVLRGYPRAAGLEIALRTLSPEVLLCDEIGAADVTSVRDVLHGGVPLVAAIHGSSLADIEKRTGVREMLSTGVFGIAVTLMGARGGWRQEVTRLAC